MSINGDLQNKYIEVGFGFDTLTKVYSESIEILCQDAIQEKKYNFVKLMGNTSSHITFFFSGCRDLPPEDATFMYQHCPRLKIIVAVYLAFFISRQASAILSALNPKVLLR